MRNHCPGRLLAVVGPSGVGKDSVMEALAAARPDFTIVQRVITRGANEIGEESVAVDETTFCGMVERGEFLLHWRAHDLSYGIPARVRDDLAGGQTLLINLSRSVLLKAQTCVDHLTVVHLTAPRTVLVERLANRGREDEDAIAKRLARADKALPDGLKDVWQVSNAGSLSDTVNEILDLLQPESAAR